MPQIFTDETQLQKKKAKLAPRLLRMLFAELLGRDFGFFFALVDQRCTLAEAFAEVGELGAADLAVALDFHLIYAGRVQRENTFHAFPRS